MLSKAPDPSLAAPTVSFTYTNNGLRQTMSDISGITTYGYDNRNRLTQKVTPFGTLSYTYDAASNLLTMKPSNSGGAADTYTYDQLNRLSTVTDASGATTYAYDAVGNTQNFTYPNGVTHAYSYDTLNRLTQVGNGAFGTSAARTTSRHSQHRKFSTRRQETQRMRIAPAITLSSDQQAALEQWK